MSRIKKIPKVAIVMGSKSDYSTMKNCVKILQILKINYEKKIVSAHRTPDRMYSFAKNAEKCRFLKFQNSIFDRKQTNYDRYVAGRSEVPQSLPKKVQSYPSFSDCSRGFSLRTATAEISIKASFRSSPATSTPVDAG